MSNVAEVPDMVKTVAGLGSNPNSDQPIVLAHQTVDPSRITDLRILRSTIFTNETSVDIFSASGYVVMTILVITT